VDIYVIPRANAGYQGGFSGQGQNLNNVVVITEKGSTKIITGYPAGAGN
jgi:filamentous hemagglutinin